jgi:hypothetical protein
MRSGDQLRQCHTDIDSATGRRHGRMFPFGPKNKMYLLFNPCVPAGTGTSTVPIYSVRYSIRETGSSECRVHCNNSYLLSKTAWLWPLLLVVVNLHVDLLV